MDTERAYWRKHTAARREKRRRLLNSFKSRPCTDCRNVFDPVCMDFDHLPGYTKVFNISKDALNTDLDRLLEEIIKCDLVCANCHRLRTKLRAMV